MTIRFAIAIALTISGTAARAVEPDGLILPTGFHASVVADGLGGIRHMAIRDNGDIYISTRHVPGQPSVGLIALRLGPDHKAIQTEHFGSVDQGTGIRIYKNALYAASGTEIQRYALNGNILVPTAMPEKIVDGLAATNHAIAFDDKGDLFVSLDGGGNICTDPKAPKDAKPVGLKPCPNLETKGGIWRFDANRPGQNFSDGEHYATGLRNMSALDWRPGDGLYGAVHGRDGMHVAFPDIVSAADDDAIADEMFRIVKGTDMGWPYTYYDGARKLRLVAPEYGGNGKTLPVDGNYATPVTAFQPHRPAVLDLAFYSGSQFPRLYRGGAFFAMHGSLLGPMPIGRPGYNVVFVPFRNGKAEAPTVFAEGFAGPGPNDKTAKTAAYRPVGLAVGPDGALYVADSNKGRIWRIDYEGP